MCLSQRPIIPPATKGYCAVCGALCDGIVHVALDGAVVDFCDEHGVAALGRRVCAAPVADGLGCALPRGHDGSHRRAVRDLR